MRSSEPASRARTHSRRTREASPGCTDSSQDVPTDGHRQLAVQRAPALVDVRARARAVGARDSHGGQLGQQPHPGFARRQRRVGPLQLGHVAGEAAEVRLAAHHEGQRGQLHRPFGAVAAQDGQVHPAGVFPWVLAAAGTPRSTPGTLARLRSGMSRSSMRWPITSARRRPYSRSAAGLNATILRAASAIDHGVRRRVDQRVSDRPAFRDFPGVLDPADPGRDDRGQRAGGGLPLGGPPDRSATRMRAYGQE